MPRTLVNHTCERCGTVRKVSPDKLARGLQRLCRKCQGPAAAEKRRLAMVLRGGPKHITYGYCKECRATYEMAPIHDDGYCSDHCKDKGQAHSSEYLQALQLYRYGAPLSNNLTKPPTEHYRS